MRYKRLSLDNQSDRNVRITIRYRWQADATSVDTATQHRLAWMEPLTPKQSITVEHVVNGSRADFMIPVGAIVTSVKAEFDGYVKSRSKPVDAFQAFALSHQGRTLSVAQLLLNKPYLADHAFDIKVYEPWSYNNSVVEIADTTVEERDAAYARDFNKNWRLYQNTARMKPIFMRGARVSH